MPSLPISAQVASPEMRDVITRVVKRRVPACDVDDVVQTVLCDALGAGTPHDVACLRSWLVAIARHRVADYHRAGQRAERLERAELAGGNALSMVAACEWIEWAERSTEPAEQSSLRWMAREACGETLAEIAAEERVAPALVRQRVSRLRRHLHRRWRVELATLALLGLLAYFASPSRDAPVPTPDPVVVDDVVGRWHRMGFTAALQVDPVGARWDAFVHDHPELLRVVDGRMLLELDGGVRHLGPGDEVLVPAGKRHSIRNDGATALRWLYGTPR
jgi:DNA-directed RNA polymerase specialized sigma24 family protein